MDFKLNESEEKDENIQTDIEMPKQIFGKIDALPEEIRKKKYKLILKIAIILCGSAILGAIVQIAK